MLKMHSRKLNRSFLESYNKSNQGEMSQQDTFRNKVVFIGDGGVGKTSIARMKFRGKYTPTLGVEVHPIKHGKHVFSIWDTAGQEKFSGLRDGYYLGAALFVVFFDTTSFISFKNVPTWIRDAIRIMPNKPIILVGTKTDVRNDRKVTKEMIEKVCDATNIPYIDTSAKTGLNLDTLLDMMAKEVE